MRILILFVSILLVACNARTPTFTPYKVEIRQGNLITQDMRAKIKVGMTQSQVKAALGAPLINDPYHANRWDYVYSLEQQGKIVENQRLTLYFKGDKLSRIDDATPLKPAGPDTQEKSNGKG